MDYIVYTSIDNKQEHILRLEKIYLSQVKKKKLKTKYRFK